MKKSYAEYGRVFINNGINKCLNLFNKNIGIGVYFENFSTGVLLVYNSLTASTGDLLQFKKNSVITTKIDHNGMITTPPATLSNQVVVKSQLDLKSDLASPAFTGIPTAPTAAAGTNTTQIATTAFVQETKKITVRKISTNITLADSDNATVILLTASATITLPNGLMSGFNASFATQVGATLTYSLGGSVVLINNALTTMPELSSHTLVNTGTSNEYLTVGL